MYVKQRAEELRIKEMKERELKESKREETLKKRVFGEEKALKLEKELNSKKKDERINELAKPKDKW